MESTNIPVEIEAKFKQATVKGGVAVLQFEVDTEDSAAFDAIRKSGEEVWLPSRASSRRSCSLATTGR